MEQVSRPSTTGAVGGVSLNSISAYDAAHAELVLLGQNLAQGKRVSDRMTVGLTAFDDRLARLERSVAGIHKGTIGLTRVQRNIETTLKAIDGLLSQHDLADREEAVVRKGPTGGNLSIYRASLNKLVMAHDALRKGDNTSVISSRKMAEQDATATRLLATIEYGNKQLGEVFLTWLREASEGSDSTISSSLAHKLHELMSYMKKLPNGHNLEKDLQKTYGEIRGNAMANQLESVGKEATDSCRMAGSGGGGRTLGSFLDRFFTLAKAEHHLAGTIFPAFTTNYVYRAIIPPSLNVLYNTGQSILTVVRKSLASTVSVAFQCFADLQAHAEEFEDWVRAKASRKDNELGELLHAFRGSCLRSLPEFIEETKAWGLKPLALHEQPSAAIGDMTVNVINYMTQLCNHQEVAETFLQTLGDGNWLMGGGAAGRTGNADPDASLLEKYLGDVLSTLMTALDSRARTLARSKPGVNAIFLLNNLSYIRREILSTSVGDVLGESAEDLLNKRNRTAKANYLDVFSPLVGCLMDAGLEGGSSLAGAIKGAVGGQSSERREVKDRFHRFEDALGEIEVLHRTARLDAGEVEMRERLKGEVDRMVIPTYSKFASRNPIQQPGSKYRGLEPSVVSTRLAAMFQ